MASLATQSELIGNGVVLLLAGAAVTGCWRLGVFRPIRAPARRRWSQGESPFLLLMVLALGLGISTVIVGMIGKAMHWGESERMVLGGALFYLTGFISLAGLNAALRPEGTRRLGLDASHLAPAVPWSLLAICVTLPVIYAVGFFVTLAINALGWPQPDPHQILKELLQGNSVWRARLLVLMAVGLAPLFEETLFRGLLQTFISRMTGRPWAAILLTAVAFASVHGVLAFVLPLMVLAIALGWLYERTGNLWATILVHGLFNSFQVLVFLKMQGHG